jgi:hypothetical protein
MNQHDGEFTELNMVGGHSDIQTARLPHNLVIFCRNKKNVIFHWSKMKFYVTFP